MAGGGPGPARPPSGRRIIPGRNGDPGGELSQVADYTAFTDRMHRIKKQALRSSWDSPEYFLRSVVFVCPRERRMENRNQRGCESVENREAVSGRAATGGTARPGGTAGERVSSGLFSRVERLPCRAPRTTREKARDRHPAGHPVGPVLRPRIPCLLGETSGHAYPAGRPGAR